jgi:hypothetical protein
MKALENIKKSKQKPIGWDKCQGQFLDMAKRYFEDALYYKDRGDIVTAFAAVTYAHGWIDAGVALGLFDAPKNSSEYIMPRE